MCCMPSRSPRISRTPRPPSPPLRATDHHLIVNASGCFSDLGTYLTMAKRGVALVISGRRAQISPIDGADLATRSEEHTSELQSRGHLVCRLLLVTKKT